MCDRVVSENSCLIVNCPDEAIVDSLVALKLILDWFVISKINKKLFNSLYPDDNIF